MFTILTFSQRATVFLHNAEMYHEVNFLPAIDVELKVDPVGLDWVHAKLQRREETSQIRIHSTFQIPLFRGLCVLGERHFFLERRSYS